MRVKRLFRLLTVLAGFGSLLAVVGFASTRLLVSDGVERFTGEERAVAQEALLDAHFGCLDNPIARVVIPKIRVIEVQFVPGRCPTVSSFTDPYRDYRVVLRAYTVFGIPTGTISVCGEVDCRG